MKKGFTLAEVLITLSIIGIVATMTIPTLMANQQKTQYLTALKKAYSEYNQALVLFALDKGCPGDLKCTGFFTPPANIDVLTFGDGIVKYFKVIKNCKTTADLGCFSNKVSEDFDGKAARTSYDNQGFYEFITADGMSFAISNSTGACADLSLHVTNNMTQYCGDAIIDTNGPNKGPNNFGRDIHWFYMSNGKGPLLYPAGGGDDMAIGTWDQAAGGCGPASAMGVGYLCTGKIIEQGWQMNY